MNGFYGTLYKRRERYKYNRINILERNRNYYKNNSEYIIDYNKKYRQDNAEKIKIKSSKRYQLKKEKIKEERKKYYQKNKQHHIWWFLQFCSVEKDCSSSVVSIMIDFPGWFIIRIHLCDGARVSGSYIVGVLSIG